MARLRNKELTEQTTLEGAVSMIFDRLRSKRFLDNSRCDSLTTINNQTPHITILLEPDGEKAFLLHSDQGELVVLGSYPQGVTPQQVYETLNNYVSGGPPMLIPRSEEDPFDYIPNPQRKFMVAFLHKTEMDEEGKKPVFTPVALVPSQAKDRTYILTAMPIGKDNYERGFVDELYRHALEILTGGEILTPSMYAVSETLGEPIEYYE